jgi:DNA processing protein
VAALSNRGLKGVKLSDEQRLDWLQLIRSENIGPRIFRELINRYGGARGSIDALPALAKRGGAASFKLFPREDAERELAAINVRGARLVALGEPDYPSRLQTIYDAPPLLTVRGRAEILSEPMVGIVGSRNASAAGMKFAERIARELGEAGFVIASGLARGIDAAAHRGSLASGTVAVLAGGHNHIYPSEHESLLESIVETGAAIAEMPIGWEPRAHDFPRRNRLISGLAAGIVVVEAAKRSGSLITARMAAEQGREVFAVPGSPLDPRCEGTNALLKQGATLMTEAADVIETLQPILGRVVETPLAEPDQVSQAGAEPGDDERSRIVSLLGPTPVSMDDIVRLSNSRPAIVRTVLLELEIAGRLERHGAGMVSLL